MCVVDFNLHKCLVWFVYAKIKPTGNPVTRSINGVLVEVKHGDIIHETSYAIVNITSETSGRETGWCSTPLTCLHSTLLDNLALLFFTPWKKKYICFLVQGSPIQSWKQLAGWQKKNLIFGVRNIFLYAQVHVSFWFYFSKLKHTHL